MDPVHIVLHGEPVAKGRARSKLVKGRISLYTPPATAAYERALAWVAKVAMKGREPLVGPLRVTVMAFIAIPASWGKEVRANALKGDVRATSRPDIDNYAKAAFDPLNSIVWKDDAQIVSAHIVKLYAAEPRLEITVEPI
jgi:Holliday junction resolvase RusA-like endonuclease